MKETLLKKYTYFAYSLGGYAHVALNNLWKEQEAHGYFVSSKTINTMYKKYGLMNMTRALVRAPKNLNFSTTGVTLFKNAYFPETKKTVLSTSIEITTNCPYRCSGCYLSEEQKKSDFFMSEEDLRKTISTHLHSTFILIQGGEPLQKNSVDMVYNVLKDFPNQIFVIVTTGVYISKYGLGKFKNLGNILWSISINGPKEINDNLRFKGSHKHAMNAMENIREAQQYFVATVTISKDNVEEATSEEFILSLSKKGVKEIRYIILRDNKEKQLSLEEIEYFEESTRKYNKYLFTNFCSDDMEDYSVIDPYTNKRIDRTGYDHTLEYSNSCTRKVENEKHYF